MDITAEPPISSALWHEDVIGDVAPSSTNAALASSPKAAFAPPKREAAASTSQARSGAPSAPKAAPAPKAPARRQQGRGRGPREPMEAVVGGRARPAPMDSGLREALGGLDAELRRRMDTFVADRRAGSRLKLPQDLRALPHKAVHVWAEVQGVHHQSFGYRGRRRLHLSFDGADGAAAPCGGAAGNDDEDFDYAAWASRDSEDEDEEEGGDE